MNKGSWTRIAVRPRRKLPLSPRLSPAPTADAAKPGFAAGFAVVCSCALALTVLAACAVDPPVDAGTGDTAGDLDSAHDTSVDSAHDTSADSTSVDATDADADGATSDVDCDDADPGVYPGAAERCDGVDEDCDGLVDDEPEDGATYAPDTDGDGYGDPDATTSACAAPAGFVEDVRDCDDSDPEVYPGTWDPYPRGHSLRSVGSEATDLAVGDLDGDGLADAAVVAPDGLLVQVLLGGGAGGFVVSDNVNLPRDPSAVTLGDFDGDGIPDLAVAVEGEVVVRTGVGDGTFLGGDGSATGCSTLTSLATADLDGDGLDDVAAGCSDPAFVAMIADGTGAFAAASQALPSAASRVVVADFDADGDVDAAMAGNGGSAAHVLLNDGGGGFSTRTESLLAATDALGAGDLDGDGDVDLVTGTTDDADLVFLANDGAGGFTATGVAGPERASGTTALCVLDHDGDGDDDLFADHARFDGSPTGPADAGDESGVPLTLEDLVAADLDGDGVIDLVATGEGSVDASRGNGDGTFVGPLRLEQDGELVVVTYGDFNADGDDDIAAVVDYATIAWYLNDGDGNYGASGQYTPGGDLLDLAAGDLDGDGDADLAATKSSGGVTAVFLEAGVLASSATAAPTVSGAELAVADIDADGDSDLVVVESQNDGFSTLFNDGTGAFTSASLTTVGSYTYVNTLVVDDFTGDGVLDVVTSDFLYWGTSVYAGDGTGAFVEVGTIQISDSAEHLAAGDVDADGDVDLFVGGWQDMLWYLALNDGAGASFTLVQGALSAPATFATVADLDGDTHPDVLAGGAVFRGDGAGAFGSGEWLDWAVGSKVDHVVLDANGDGWSDIGMAGQGGAQVRVWCPE